MTEVTGTEIYNNRYEIIRQIARGGMAEVYLARDLQLHRNVALKVLFRELSIDQAFVKRFRHEAQAAANLSHPNIVSIFDWGESEEDNTYYIVMELVDGQPLSKLIRSRGTIEPVRAAEIGRDIASGLGYAHSRGVIHRDVKPGNIILTDEGVAKVTDFGIARGHNVDESLTQTGAVMGTATYFSPEQAQGEGVDGRSDIYSLAVLLYEMVIGKPPFTGDNAVAIATKHVRDVPVSLTERDPTIPSDLEAIIMKAMAKSSDDRYQTAEQLRDDLSRFIQGSKISAPAYDPSVTAFYDGGAAATTVVKSQPGDKSQLTAKNKVVSPSNPSEPLSAPPHSKARVVAWILGLIVILGALGVGSYIAVSNMSSSTSFVGVDVPNLIGMKLAKAETVLESHGIKWHISFISSASPPLTVVGQTPTYPTPVPKGTYIQLQVSKGGRSNISNQIGTQLQLAQNALQNAGFKVSVNKKIIPCSQVAQFSTPPVRNSVISQSPSSGTAPAGSTIVLGVSQGVAVPNVTGQPSSAASNILGQCQLNVGTTTNIPSPTSSIVPAGDVISTNPAPGTLVDPNSTVDLTVSSGPGVSVPGVTNESLKQAEADIQNAQLTYVIQYQSTNLSSQVGMVISQTPSAGTFVNINSAVTIVVGQQATQPTSPPNPSSTTSSTTSTTTPSANG